MLVSLSPFTGEGTEATSGHLPTGAQGVAVITTAVDAARHPWWTEVILQAFSSVVSDPFLK